ncbi:MAG TPA: hypothetical protein VG318_12700 [Actinomycetota bacterium]|nr:hypothetical protein [Actinomycetota bacterium]
MFKRHRKSRSPLDSVAVDELYQWAVQRASMPASMSSATDELAAEISLRADFEISPADVALVANVALSPDNLSWVRVEVDREDVLASEVLPEVQHDSAFAGLVKAVKEGKASRDDERTAAARDLLAYARKRDARLGDLQMLSGRLLAEMPRQAEAYYIVNTALGLLNAPSG